MTQNVTFDPLSRARVVARPAIAEVMSWKTGRFWDVAKLIGSRRYDVVLKLRNAIADEYLAGRIRFVCPGCQVPVYLVAGPTKSFFFRHRVENGSCPAVTRDLLTASDIRARKYKGVQESEAHKRLKRLIMRSLVADLRIALPAEERTWRAVDDPRTYRRPDVSAVFEGVGLAFEGQLSTTFLSVVAERRAFYRAEGGLLVWVLSRFSPDYRRMTEDDILFSNNSNVFVVDEDTALASETEGRFVLRCWYRVPSERSESGGSVWAQKVVPFDALTRDVGGQRLFLVDVEGEERQALTAWRGEASDEQLREAFFNFWRRPLDWPAEERNAAWAWLRQQLESRGLELPAYHFSEPGFANLWRALMSAKAGKPDGWKYKSLVEVAHHLFEVWPGYLTLFSKALRTYGNLDLLAEQDTSGKWKPKVERLRASLDAGEPTFQPSYKSKRLIVFMFPELAPKPQADDQRAA